MTELEHLKVTHELNLIMYMVITMILCVLCIIVSGKIGYNIGQAQRFVDENYTLVTNVVTTTNVDWHFKK